MNSVRTCIAACALGALASSVASAQSYPTRPVRIVVPQAPDGASDALARIIGEKLGERWHQQVVVDNRPGAGGVIGTDIVAKAAPDGYSLLLAYDGTHAINASLYKSLPFDTLKDGATLIRTKEVSDAFAAQGAEPFITTPAAFAQILKRDIDKWAVVVRESGAKVD